MQEATTQAISKGLTWLKSDEARKLGYDLNRVRLDDIRMNNPTYCVLGQASPTGWFWDAPRPHPVGPLRPGFLLGEDGDWDMRRKAWDVDHGFWTLVDGGWDQVTDAWVAAIQADRDSVA